MENRSIESILAKLLEYVGFIILILAMAMTEDNYFWAQCSLFIIGLSLLVWGAYEDGYFKKGGKEK